MTLFNNLKLILIRIVKALGGSLLIRSSAGNSRLGSSDNTTDLTQISLSSEAEAQLRDVHELESILRDNNNFENVLNESHKLTNKLNRQSDVFEESIGRYTSDNFLNSSMSVSDTSSFRDLLFGMFKSIKTINNNAQNNSVSKAIMDKHNSVVNNSTTVELSNQASDSWPWMDLTLREVHSKFLDIMEGPISAMQTSPTLQAASGVAIEALPPILVFRSLVAAYNKVVPLPKSPLTTNQIIQRQATFFIIMPTLTVFIMNLKQPLGGWLQEKGLQQILGDQIKFYVDSIASKENLSSNQSAAIEEISNSDPNNGSEVSSNSSLSVFLPMLAFKGKNKYISLFILFCVLTLVLIYKIYNFNVLYFLYFNLTHPSLNMLKYSHLAFAVFNLIFTVYNIINITTIYLVKTNKLTKSIFKPSFLNNFIGTFEEEVKHENLNEIIDFYYKHLYIFIILFLYSMLVYFML